MFRLPTAPGIWEMPSAALSTHEVGLAGSRVTLGSIPQQSQKSPNHQYVYLAHDIAHVCAFPRWGAAAPKAAAFLEVQPHIRLGASLGHESPLLLQARPEPRSSRYPLEATNPNRYFGIRTIQCSLFLRSIPATCKVFLSTCQGKPSDLSLQTTEQPGQTSGN